MKKILSLTLILAAACAVTSCVNEEDLIFDKTAAERLNEASSLYSSRLMASPNGWAMQLYPTNENEYPYGNGYLLLCRFNKDHSVNVSMDNVFSENKYKEDTSLWEIITDNGPVLTFNSHNSCLHAFCDPEDIFFTGNADEANDETGKGCQGDYEFIIVDAPEDASYMMLKGKKRGTYNLLTPVEVGVEYADYLADVKTFQNTMFPSNAPTFNVMHFGDSIYKMTGANDGIPNIFPYDGDEIIDQSFNAFLITKRGNDYYLRFRDKITVTEEEKVQDFRYNASSDVFESVDNASYYIDGDEPARFFEESLSVNERAWIWNATSQMSDKYAELMATLKTELGKNTLQQIRLQKVDDKYKLRVTYRSKTTTTLVYSYTGNFSGGVLNLTYEGCDTPSGEAILNQVPSLREVLNMLTGGLSISAGTTKFNLNTIKLTSTSDSSMWFVANLL